jgi:hypothetical protein
MIDMPRSMAFCSVVVGVLGPGGATPPDGEAVGDPAAQAAANNSVGKANVGDRTMR